MITVPYPNTYWVVPAQFLAGEHPADLDDATTTARLSSLLAAGVRTFVDLTQEHEADSYHQLLQAVAADCDTDSTVLRIPIPDRKVPSVSTLRCILDVIDSSLRVKNPVFVHCFAGIGRTGTVVGCYLRRHGLANRQDVITHIAGLRMRMPIASESSPHTSEQVRFVENWNEGL
jgi:protein-tyrosine phosphatase